MTLEKILQPTRSKLGKLRRSFVSGMKNIAYGAIIGSLPLLSGNLMARANAQEIDAQPKVVFNETFEDINSVLNNNGDVSSFRTPINFTRGVKGNAIEFSRMYLNTNYVSYPTPEGLTQGSIGFWFKPSPDFYEKATNIYGHTRPQDGFIDFGDLGGFYNGSLDKVMFELYLEVDNPSNNNIWIAQSESLQGLKFSTEFHHVAFNWKSETGEDSMQLFLDGVPGNLVAFKKENKIYPLTPQFSVGNHFYYTNAKSLVDEVKIYSSPRSAQQIKAEYNEVVGKNSPQFTSFYPQETAMMLEPGTSLVFSVASSDPNNDPIETSWFVDSNSVSFGSVLEYVVPQTGGNTVKSAISDGMFKQEKQWDVYSKGTDWKIYDGHFLVDGSKFNLNGICYTPWLKGTGPDPYRHLPLPGEFEDVTELVRNPATGAITVPDYSRDGKIQTWEVFEYDLKMMKALGANTIRVYGIGEWHDKNLNGKIDRNKVPELDEIMQGDLPNWALDRMMRYCGDNGLKVILGYQVQEENFRDEDPNIPGYQLTCDSADLEVAKDTLNRVVGKYGNSPAIIAWCIGNEVPLQTWFRWGPDYREYLNQLNSHVRSIDPKKRPIMYAKFIGEGVNFENLNVDVMAPNAYIFSAQELVEKGEFRTYPGPGRMYVLGEFGHLIGQAPEQWALAGQYGGGCFLEYVNVLWKGGDQSQMGVFNEYREKNPERHAFVSQAFNK